MINDKAVTGARSNRWGRALPHTVMLILGIVSATAAFSADLPARDFTRVAWLSTCEPDESVTYFFLDLLAEGLLRYEGVIDVKTLGPKEEQLQDQAEKQLRSALRDFLAGKARVDKQAPGPEFCVQVRVYKADRVVDARSATIYANQLPAVLQKINESASLPKWACPARLSSTGSGSSSARYCGWPAFTFTVVGRSVCDLSRHVEVYLDGSVYIASYISRGDRLVDHSYYEIDRSVVADLVEMINTFETVFQPALEGGRPTFRRMRPEDIDVLKRRLSDVIEVSWTPPEVAACDEPSTATEEVSLRRDLDRKRLPKAP